MRYAPLSLFGLVALVALVACGGSGSQPATTPTTSAAACGGSVVDTQAKLSAPEPGATGVSPSVGQLSYTYGNEGLSAALVTLTPSDGSSGLLLGYDSIVSAPESSVVTYRMPALKAATTYTASASTVNMAHVSCYVTVTASLGSFTTQ